MDVTDAVSAANEPQPPASAGQPEVADERTALVSRWCSRVRKAKKHHEDAFKRMSECMELATNGAPADWIKDKKFVVPIINRHINQAVSQLYAKNPQVDVKRRQRMMYQIWDEDPQSLQAAMVSVTALQQAQAANPMAAMTGQAPPAEAMQAQALLQEIQQVKATERMLDQIGKTLGICWQYYMDEQDADYRQQIKAAVRRTKVCGVGYFKLGFQRMLEKRPEITAQINDVTSKMALVERLLAEAADGKIEEHSAEMEQLRLLLQDLQSQEMMVVREGPVIDFPRAKEIIIDPACRHLKSLAGAEWIAHEFDMHPDDIKEIYGVDVGDGYSHLKCEEDEKDKAKPKARVWEIQDKRSRQVLTVCDGYKDFLREPKEPSVAIERFFTVFPLVFNEVESEKELYPPSDVWLAKDTQNEYNRSRQGLREHRIANRPYYVSRKGALEENDKQRLSDHEAHELIELISMQQGEKISDIVDRGPNVPIDPNQYEVEFLFNDLLRTVGTQEANLGGTSNATATETSVAEQSRTSTREDNVDDLDAVLTALARAGGQLMLLELSKETVMEIAGPGAVWPDAPQTRQELAKEIFLETKAASSGRPNRAAELANWERALPFVIQLPGIPPEFIAKKLLPLLDIDITEAYVEGLPSIMAMNAAAKTPAPPPTDNPQEQGGNGGDNQEKPPEKEQGSQPAFPTPAPVA